MSLFRTSDYAGKKEVIKKVKLATQDKTRKVLTFCPLRCTQKRNKNNRLTERKTFDPKHQVCLNCGHKKINAVKPLYFKASELGRQ